MQLMVVMRRVGIVMKVLIMRVMVMVMIGMGIVCREQARSKD